MGWIEFPASFGGISHSSPAIFGGVSCLVEAGFAQCSAMCYSWGLAGALALGGTEPSF